MHKDNKSRMNNFWNEKTSANNVFLFCFFKIETENTINILKNVPKYVKKRWIRELFLEKKLTRLKNKTEENFTYELSLIKMNELKLNQVELFYFFHYMRAAANASESFNMAHLGNIELFL